MVKKTNSVKIKKPVLDLDGTKILMDRHWFDHIKGHLKDIDKELPIKMVHNQEDHLLVEFKSAKIATMFRLKYGDKGQ
jgi:hypothetical protein